jgi:hypothetical protein
MKRAIRMIFTFPGFAGRSQVLVGAADRHDGRTFWFKLFLTAKARVGSRETS